MKKLVSLSLLVLIMLFMLSACAKSGAGEAEPNNTYAEANEISMGADVKGTIKSNEDEDWFCFTLPSTADIRIDMSFGRWSPSEACWIVTLYDGYGVNVIDYYKEMGKGNLSLDFGVLKEGMYLVRINASHGGDHVSYTMNVNKTHECNPVSTVIQEATCTEDGMELVNCAICNTTIEYKTIKAEGHKSHNWIIEGEATCLKEGLRQGTCYVCNEDVKEIIPKTDHLFGEWKTISGNVIIPPIVKEKACVHCSYSETIEDWGYVWVTVLAAIGAIGLCVGVVAYFKAYKNP